MDSEIFCFLFKQQQNLLQNKTLTLLRKAKSQEKLSKVKEEIVSWSKTI